MVFNKLIFFHRTNYDKSIPLIVSLAELLLAMNSHESEGGGSDFHPWLLPTLAIFMDLLTVASMWQQDNVLYGIPLYLCILYYIPHKRGHKNVISKIELKSRLEQQQYCSFCWHIFSWRSEDGLRCDCILNCIFLNHVPCTKNTLCCSVHVG